MLTKYEARETLRLMATLRICRELRMNVIGKIRKIKIVFLNKLNMSIVALLATNILGRRRFRIENVMRKHLREMSSPLPLLAFGIHSTNYFTELPTFHLPYKKHWFRVREFGFSAGWYVELKTNLAGS